MKSSDNRKFINRPCSYITWNCQIIFNKNKLNQIENLVDKFDPIQECNIKKLWLESVENKRIQEVSQTITLHGKARILAYVKNNAKTIRQMNLEDDENDIIVINHQHQHGLTRVQGIYRTFISATGMSSLPDQERRILKLLNNTGINILRKGSI